MNQRRAIDLCSQRVIYLVLPPWIPRSLDLTNFTENRRLITIEFPGVHDHSAERFVELVVN
jgi:hypothetical protein